MTFVRWMLCAAVLGPHLAYAEEQAAFVVMPGFEPVFVDGSGTEFDRAYVPDGQSVEAWSERQTHQRFPGLVDSNPIEVLRILAGDLQADCPEIGFRVTNGRVAGGYPNAAIYGRCPAGDARPDAEFFVIVAISGDEAVHVVQHAWRGAAPSDAVFTDRLRALTEMPLCQSARSPDPCP